MINKPTQNHHLVLMAVLAHPDDESFGMGGTLALYASRGIEVHLVCATRGELGEVSPELMKGYASVAELRMSELKCAAGVLGIKTVHHLNYRDSGMAGAPTNFHPEALAAQPVNDVAARIVHFIRMVKPQVILTFDPIGGYRHPDHIMCHRATVKAFNEADNPEFAPEGQGGYQPERLYFHIFPRGLVRFAVKILPFIGQDPHKWGRNKDIDLVELAIDDFPSHAVVNYRSVSKQKVNASACHVSQGGAQMGNGLIAFMARLFGNRDRYMRAYPPFFDGEKVEQDLFDNL